VIDGFVAAIIGQHKEMAHNEIHELQEEIARLKALLSGPTPLVPVVRASFEIALATAEQALATALSEASSDIEFDTTQDLEGVYPLDLSLCGIPPQDPEPTPPACPPLCVPKKCSPVDWTKIPNKDPILNEGVCEFWVPITTKYLNAKTKKISEIEEEYINEGIELILNSAGKKVSDSIIESLRSSAATDNFVDFRNLAKIKVLVKIPVDSVATLEDKEEKSQDDTQDPSDFPLTVTLKADDLSGPFSMFSIAKKAIGNKYSKQYERATIKREITGLPKNILLKLEAQRIGSFRKNLIQLLKKQNFKINPVNKKGGVLEGVEIAFKEDYKGISYIKANKIGCEPVELGSKLSDVIDGGAGWKTFIEKSEYQTTLAFVANIPSIYEDVTADNPIPVDAFLLKYYFPKIEKSMVGEQLAAAREEIDNNLCNVNEVVANLLKPVLIPGADIVGQALKAPQLFFDEVAENACLTLEGKREQDNRFNLDFEAMEKRFQDVKEREYFTGDAIFADLAITLGQVTNLKELYKEILDKVGVCGLSSLAFDGIKCLMKGLDIGDATGLLIKSFIKNATEKEMESIFFKFNPGLQQFIRDGVAQITSIPLPWEAGYRPGSYQSAGVKYSADYLAPSGSNQMSLQDRLYKTTELIGAGDEFAVNPGASDGLTLETSLKSFRARQKTTIQEQKDKYQSFTPIPLTDDKGDPVLDDNGNQKIIKSPEGVMPAPGLGPRNFAGPFAHAGSVGTALDNIQDNAIDILKDVIIDGIQNELISADFIMNSLNNIPGASLLKGAIANATECPLPPLFSPPLDDILKTLELDFCGGHYAITLPVMPKFSVRPFFGDIKTLLINAAEDAIEELVVRAMTIILEKLLGILFNVSCEVLKDAAGITKDLLGGADFREVVAENICGDSLNDEGLNRSLNDLNKALGAWNVPGISPPTDGDVGELMDGTSAILTQQELLDLLDGAASDRVVSYVRQIVDGIPNIAAVLPTNDHIRDLFIGMGRIFDKGKIRDRIANTSFKPISPTICGSPEHLQLFDDIRCGILIAKGLTPEQCEDQIDKLKERTRCDFEQLANLLNENYFDNSQIASAGSPNCPTPGAYPVSDSETKKMTQELFDSNYEVINSSFLKELAVGDGMINMILSDTLGVGYKGHNEFWIKYFGQPSSQDLRLMQFYADKDVGTPSLLQAPVVNTVFAGEAVGVYPDTVALYLQNILKGDLKVEFFSDPSTDKRSGIILEYENWESPPAVPPPYPIFKFLTIEYYYNNDDDTLSNIFISSNDDTLGPPLGVDIKKAYDADIINKILYLGGSSPNSAGKPGPLTNQGYIFGKLITSAWSNYTTDQAGLIEEQTRGPIFDYITEKVVEKFANKISENSRTFDFGYNAGAEGKIMPLDPEKYGGTAKNPAFYVDPPKHVGWMDLYDKIIPEVNGCSAESQSILGFNTISEKTGEYSEKLRDDPRLQIPEACAIDTERPFDRIMPRASLAGTDGAIMATTRLYVMEVFLKSLPSFSLFDPKAPQIYDDVLLSYIAKKMKEGLLNTGINFRTAASKERYYYTFLEEVVQNFGKKVDAEIIVPTEAQIDAMEKINEVQATFRTSSAKKGAFTNYRKNLRDLKINYVKALEPECLILLNHYISEQVKEVGNTFAQVMSPAIKNLEDLIFGSKRWMVAGSLKDDSGPMNVPKDPLNPADDTVIKILDLEGGTATGLQSGDYGAGYFPFILEKYIKVRPLSKSPLLSGIGVSRNNYQIYNFDELLDDITNNGTASSPISENFSSWSYGLRISMVMSDLTKASIDSGGFYNSISDTETRRDRSLKIGTPSNSKFVIPVAVVELPIDSETLQMAAVAGFDINCMVGELINTPEYKTLFNYCFPLQSLLSLVTIYIAEAFLLALGEEWDGGISGSHFKRWDRGSDFKKTKKILRRLFEGYYHSRDASYEDPEDETQEEKTRKAVRVKKKVPTDKQIKWWKKKLQVPKPAEECE
jgi:hypothetical protein